MAGNLIRTLLLAFIVLTPAGLSFGQTNDTSSANESGNTIPSIEDLMTVIDKATSQEAKGKDWSTPVKLVIIFSGLAILPSLW